MAQQLTASLRDYFTRTPNPRANQLGSMDRAYAHTVAETPEQLFRNAVNLPEPIVYLVADATMDGPLPISCIFSIDTPGGPQNTGNHYAFVGDVPSPGATPPIIQVTHEIFDLVGPHRVNTHASRAQAWGNVQPDAHRLPRPANDADAREVTVRHATPVPHPHVAPILEAHANGTLTHRWLHNQILNPIQGDPATAAAYTNFVDWLQAASTLAPVPGPPPQPDRSPVDMEYAAIFGVPQVLARAPGILAQHLPGLRSTTPMQASMVQIAQSQQNLAQQQQNIAQLMQQAATTAAQPAREKTLQEKSPLLWGFVLRMCEQPTIDQCTPFWQKAHLVSKSGVLPLLLNELANNGANHNMVDAQFATDLYNVAWAASTPSSLTEGISITRLVSFRTPAHVQALRNEANRTYQLLASVDTSTPALTEVILAKSAANIPENVSELRALVTGFNQMLVTLWGHGTQHTTAFRTQVVDKMDEIEQLIIHSYSAHEKQVCLIAILWIVRTTRQAYMELMQGPLPTVATPQPVTQAPPYNELLKALQFGNILTLQDIPEALVQQRRPLPSPAPAPAPPPRGHAPAPAPGPSPPGAPNNPAGGANSRAPVRHPNQNPRLKQAWARGGEPNRSVYQRAGDPFYDAALPAPHKKVVMRLTGNRQQRICLPMACKGTCTNTCQGYHGELTPAEEEAVAAAATPPLAL